jgi:hypothetical protein
MKPNPAVAAHARRAEAWRVCVVSSRLCFTDQGGRLQQLAAAAVAEAAAQSMVGQWQSSGASVLLLPACKHVCVPSSLYLCFHICSASYALFLAFLAFFVPSSFAGRSPA